MKGQAREKVQHLGYCRIPQITAESTVDRLRRHCRRKIPKATRPGHGHQPELFVRAAGDKPVCRAS